MLTVASPVFGLASLSTLQSSSRRSERSPARHWQTAAARSAWRRISTVTRTRPVSRTLSSPPLHWQYAESDFLSFSVECFIVWSRLVHCFLQKKHEPSFVKIENYRRNPDSCAGMQTATSGRFEHEAGETPVRMKPDQNSRSRFRAKHHLGDAEHHVAIFQEIRVVACCVLRYPCGTLNRGLF